MTSIVVTHDMPSAFLVSDRLAMLEGRRIRAVLPNAEFRTSEDPAIREFISAMSLEVPAPGRAGARAGRGAAS